MIDFRNTIALAAAAALVGVSAASANHIDFIQDDSDSSDGVDNATFLLRAGSGETVSDTQVGEEDDILGGTRAVTLSETRGNARGQTSAEKREGTDFIDFENNAQGEGTLTLDYADFENVDFQTVWDSIQVSISAADDTAVVDLTLNVFSSAGNGSVTQTIDGAGDYVFAFSDSGFSGVDFFDVDRVTAIFDTVAVGSDIQIESITREVLNVIPSPSAAGLGLVGGLGLLMGRRRSNG